MSPSVEFILRCFALGLLMAGLMWLHAKEQVWWPDDAGKGGKQAKARRRTG